MVGQNIAFLKSIQGNMQLGFLTSIHLVRDLVEQLYNFQVVYSLQVNVFITFICNFKHMILGNNELVVLMNLIA